MKSSKSKMVQSALLESTENGNSHLKNGKTPPPSLTMPAMSNKEESDVLSGDVTGAITSIIGDSQSGAAG